MASHSANFDILSGISALLLGIALFLANIVTIAVLATPRFHAFGATHLNTLVAEPPFVLLPTILVQAALLGHILVFRRLRALTPLNASSNTGSKDRHHPDTAAVKA